MKVLLLASEVYPFAKTGGLGDVTGALPRALAALGLEVAVLMPLYRRIRSRRDRLSVVASSVTCAWAGGDRPFRLLGTTLPGAPEVPVWFVENEGIFEVEDDIYGTSAGSYGDGHLRFLYFSAAALRVPAATGFIPDVFHLNDWQTAAVAPLLRFIHRRDPALSKSATVLTIHNLAYQGVFGTDSLRGAGVPEPLLEEGRLLEGGEGRLLAGGIRYADAISTVSRTYAREILTEKYGNGLDGLLRWREPLLEGIVNGLDTEVWNPATDVHIAARFDAAGLARKAGNRDAVLADFGVEASAGPVFGVVSRFVSQKGLDLIPDALAPLLAARPTARLVVLGSGDRAIDDGFARLATDFPGRVGRVFTHSEVLAHRVEAGADFFLMPSRFEPCGLNQLISMRYGTVPIVRATGGLADTVTDTTPATLADGTATGIVFQDDSVADLARAIERAGALFDATADFVAVQTTGMTSDWSWAKSAREYVRLFERALARRIDGSHLENLVPAEEKPPGEAWLPPLAELPPSYARDVLVAVPRDPWTLFAAWELGGAESTAWHSTRPELERWLTRHQLQVRDVASGHRWNIDTGGFCANWFIPVTPGGTYEVELHALVPGQASHRLLTAPATTQPPAIDPEAL